MGRREGVPVQELTGEPQLVQLQYLKNSDDAWRMLVCCILLNQTTRRQLDRIRHKLFKTYRNSHEMAEADVDELADFIRPLGLQNTRARRLKNFSEDWTTWEILVRDQGHPIPSAFQVRKMRGIGQYAEDSYRIFYLGEWDSVDPSDKELVRWVQWRRAQD